MLFILITVIVAITETVYTTATLDLTGVDLLLYLVWRGSDRHAMADFVHR